ncbi:MAG: PAS domain-containing protein [Rhodospirillaceae bacterium]|jgi:PAS domain S-box-containing protein|nr:PAS domain-containing protein [Rhodospirillaceae bacterium]MBT4687406.1 PAS domain-containing protein [Rhodospirillaceae bacterium]MBT5079694.1 PAS domain-containing protein [Rhodospirillaceae bacterium]MBT5527192.1 PAS domain-containing protein [Rhodospirillaceae bacterium]MBT5882088.1 PAS domain-containing protein [Rhodospirillaceae bacterium]
MGSIAVRHDHGDARPSMEIGRALSMDDVIGDIPGQVEADGGADRLANIASIMALLVFVLLGGMTALLSIASDQVFGLSMPPSLLFLLGVTGFLVSATSALAMRRAVLQMTHSAVGAKAAPRMHLLHGMVENIPEAIALWDKDDRLVLCNKLYRDIFSRIEDRLQPGLHFSDALNAEMEASYIPASVASNWFEKRQENHWIGDVTERRSIEGREYEIKDSHCGGGGTLTLVRDMTEIRIKERDLRDSQERYALVSLASSEGLWDMDLRTDRFYISSRVLSIIGSRTDPAAFQQEDWVSAIHPDDIDIYHQNWREHLDGESRIFDLEYRVLHSEGELRWISDRALALRDSTGHAYRIAGSVTDITSRKLAEVEMVEARDAAEIASRAKTQFLANVSHELRTPLNAIIGFSDLLGDSEKSHLSVDDQNSFLHSINQSGRDLLVVINDILDMSQIETGDMKLAEGAVDLELCIEATISMVAEQAATKGLVVVETLPAELPDLIGDQSKIKQMLLNLLSNAIKFTGTGGEIEIGVSFIEGTGIDVYVRDNGIGMDQSELDRARLSFAQANNSPSRQHGGLGLGLAITTALAELHGGAMILTSELGAGTKATLHFPAERIQ